MNRKLFFLLNYFFLALLFCQTSYGQIESSTNTIRQDYIEKYTSLTVKEMKKSGIPASIIMAQALLESDNGESELALTANNHFGIKCHQTWTGNRFYYDDDQLDDCFRAYRNVFESYRDHSLFLMNRARYHFLFDLDPNDYRAWAKGLKMAGYATNPRYADMLIRLLMKMNFIVLTGVFLVLPHGIPLLKLKNTLLNSQQLYHHKLYILVTVLSMF